jgi:mediator of RNA polymerase II transcription subunit 12, fungi type
MPHDSKSILLDPFRNYPNLSVTDLPAELPLEYRNQISSLLAQCPPNSVVTNLVNTHYDAQGNEIIGSSVTNRPWEWIENLGEPSVLDVKEDERGKDRFNPKYLVKNSGSISLDHFGARLTGDGIKHDMVTTDSVDSGTASSIRSFEDGCSEHLFIRDWRESRLEWDIEPSTETLFRLNGDSDHDASGISDGLTTVQGQRTSPPSSGTASSSSSSSTQQQQSPSHTTHSSEIEIIDVDSVPTTSLRNESLKRKVTAGDSDDEIEIIEGPVVTRVATSSKRQKIVKVPAGKTKAKKK